MRSIVALFGVGDSNDLARSVGPFAAAIVVAFWLLRRSDGREREMASTARGDLERERAAHGETRAALLEALKPRTCPNCGHVA